MCACVSVGVGEGVGILYYVSSLKIHMLKNTHVKTCFAGRKKISFPKYTVTCSP